MPSRFYLNSQLKEELTLLSMSKYQKKVVVIFCIQNVCCKNRRTIFSGEPHAKQFVFKCEFQGIEGQGIANSKKLAKRLSAEEVRMRLDPDLMPAVPSFQDAMEKKMAKENYVKRESYDYSKWDVDKLKNGFYDTKPFSRPKVKDRKFIDDILQQRAKVREESATRNVVRRVVMPNEPRKSYGVRREDRSRSPPRYKCDYNEPSGANINFEAFDGRSNISALQTQTANIVYQHMPNEPIAEPNLDEIGSSLHDLNAAMPVKRICLGKPQNEPELPQNSSFSNRDPRKKKNSTENQSSAISKNDFTFEHEAIADIKKEIKTEVKAEVQDGN